MLKTIASSDSNDSSVCGLFLFFPLLLCSRGDATADGAACLIWHSFFLRLMPFLTEISQGFVSLPGLKMGLVHVLAECVNHNTMSINHYRAIHLWVLH